MKTRQCYTELASAACVFLAKMDEIDFVEGQTAFVFMQLLFM